MPAALKNITLLVCSNALLSRSELFISDLLLLRWLLDGPFWFCFCSAYRRHVWPASHGPISCRSQLMCDLSPQVENRSQPGVHASCCPRPRLRSVRVMKVHRRPLRRSCHGAEGGACLNKDMCTPAQPHQAVVLGKSFARRPSHPAPGILRATFRSWSPLTHVFFYGLFLLG